MWDHADVEAIAPNLRDQEKATVLSKAADAATTAVNLGPWIVKHREAGRLAPSSSRSF